eukprot:14670473-Alexandrium_andersonii.AAC.1
MRRSAGAATRSTRHARAPVPDGLQYAAQRWCSNRAGDPSLEVQSARCSHAECPRAWVTRAVWRAPTLRRLCPAYGLPVCRDTLGRGRAARWSHPWAWVRAVCRPTLS